MRKNEDLTATLVNLNAMLTRIAAEQSVLTDMLREKGLLDIEEFERRVEKEARRCALSAASASRGHKD